jgi:uncharacterized membrane protein (GlpM family)
MNKDFAIYLIISFILTGFWIAIATLYTERLGSKLGGLITNLPSNILISLIFIYKIQDINYLQDTIIAVPIGMLTNSLFLVILIILLSRSNIYISALVSLLAWFIFALIALQFRSQNLILNSFIYFISTGILIILIEKCRNIKSIGQNKVRFSLYQITLRALFSGVVVAIVIFLSIIMSPYFVGIFSTFPTVLLITILILAVNQNNKFAQATGKVLILSSTNIVVYVISVYYTYPAIGIVYGTLISFLISTLYILLIHPLIKSLK